MASKQRPIKFDVDDYLKDVSHLSLNAQGLWMRMLCHMHRSCRRGYLQSNNGKPWTLQQIARDAGCDTDSVSRLLQELEDAGIFSRGDRDVIYSRRMLREAYLYQVRSQAGRKGGLQAVLLKQNFKQNSSKRSSKTQAKLKQNSDVSVDKEVMENELFMANSAPFSPAPSFPPETPLISPLSFPPESVSKPPISPPIPAALNTAEFLAAWKEWEVHRKQKRKKLTGLAVKKQLDHLASIGVARAIAAINYSIRQDWTGIFEDRDSRKRIADDHPELNADDKVRQTTEKMNRTLGETKP